MSMLFIFVHALNADAKDLSAFQLFESVQRQAYLVSAYRQFLATF